MAKRKRARPDYFKRSSRRVRGRWKRNPARLTRRRVKRRSAKRRNLEVKTQTHAVRIDELKYGGGSALLGPSNSVVLMAGLFGGRNGDDTPLTSTGLTPGTGCNGLIGCYVTPAYPSSMKLDIDYKTIVPVNGNAYPNPNLRIIHGFYKNTGDKMNASLADNFAWVDEVRANLLKELFDSDYDADYLAYTQKSRNVKILSDRVIRPKKSVAVQIPVDLDVNHPQAIIAPNQELSYKWPHKKFKTKLEPSVFLVPGTPPVPGTVEVMMPHNLWVPFLLALAPGLTATGFGNIKIRSVTKAYFHDS